MHCESCAQRKLARGLAQPRDECDKAMRLKACCDDARFDVKGLLNGALHLLGRGDLPVDLSLPIDAPEDLPTVRIFCTSNTVACAEVAAAFLNDKACLGERRIADVAMREGP